jgi:hypothetical protein
LAQESVRWTGDMTFPDPTGQGGPWTVALVFDLAAGAAGGGPGPTPAPSRPLSGTAAVTFAPPGDSKRYTMNAAAKGHASAEPGAAAWAVRLDGAFDIRTVDAATAALWASLPGSGWQQAAIVQVGLDGEASEPDGTSPTVLKGSGNVEIANFGCIVVEMFSRGEGLFGEIDPAELAAIPGRCGRTSLTAEWTVTADASCALSPAPPAETAQLFSAMLPAINHPRCQNCHGALNVFTDTRHPGGNMVKTHTVEDPTGFSEPYEEELVYDQGPVCMDCHDLAKGAWRQQRTDTIQWAGASPKRICETWLATTGPEIGRDLHAHLANDILIQLAFEGLRGVSELVLFNVESEGPLPPPMSHAAFLGLARAWIDAAGIGQPGAKQCACTGLP